jgi:hypothetical protein
MRPDTSTLLSSQELRIKNPGIYRHAAGDIAAIFPVPIEGTPSHVLSQVVRAELVFGDAKFLHTQGAVFIKPIHPTL